MKMFTDNLTSKVIKMFELTEDQLKKVEEWKKEQYKKAIEEQKKNVRKDNSLKDLYNMFKKSWDKELPFEGAYGGFLTYSFTPTSVGMDISVTYRLTDETLDLSDGNRTFPEQLKT